MFCFMAMIGVDTIQGYPNIVKSVARFTAYKTLRERQDFPQLNKLLLGKDENHNNV